MPGALSECLKSYSIILHSPGLSGPAGPGQRNNKLSPTLNLRFKQRLKSQRNVATVAPHSNVGLRNPLLIRPELIFFLIVAPVDLHSNRLSRMSFQFGGEQALLYARIANSESSSAISPCHSDSLRPPFLKSCQITATLTGPGSLCWRQWRP